MLLWFLFQAGRGPRALRDEDTSTGLTGLRQGTSVAAYRPPPPAPDASPRTERHFITLLVCKRFCFMATLTSIVVCCLNIASTFRPSLFACRCVSCRPPFAPLAIMSWSLRSPIARLPCLYAAICSASILWPRWRKICDTALWLATAPLGRRKSPVSVMSTGSRPRTRMTSSNSSSSSHSTTSKSDSSPSEPSSSSSSSAASCASSSSTGASWFSSTSGVMPCFCFGMAFDKRSWSMAK
mmetsp:Transcript_152/g.282  ORF Transcript_152/g.282 Transcript_152/m.282 type:complete len:239 (+) Transcript_152:3-719(+)